MTQQIAPTFADIESAATRLQDQAVRTPLLEVPALNRASGGRILLKAEPLQRTGSFKFRGAFNFLSQIAPETRRMASWPIHLGITLRVWLLRRRYLMSLPQSSCQLMPRK